MMDEVFAIVEHDRGRLDACSEMVVQEALALAAVRGGRATALLLAGAGVDAGAPVAELGRLGIGRVVIAPLAQEEPEPGDIDGLAAHPPLAQGAVLLAPATRIPSMVAACLAARLGWALIQDCVAVRSDGAALRFDVATAGSMAIVEAAADGGTPTAVLMPPREVERPDGTPLESGAMEVVTLAAAPSSMPPGVHLAKRVKVRREDMTLAEANVIVSGGRGLGGAEGFEPLRRLAEMLGGHVGASRVATDLGWIDRQHLVGMSGSTVRPALYLACGISGAPHHLMGMRDATLIVALNTDEGAPLLSTAHHAFVGDAHEVIPKVIDRLRAAASESGDPA